MGRRALYLFWILGVALHAGWWENVAEGRFLDDYADRNEAWLAWENDAMTIKNRDRYYTNGVRIGYRRLSVPEVGADAIQHYGIRIGQDIYTPEDLTKTSSELGSRDHPYAGWLFAEVFTEAYARREGETSYARYSLALGCLGPCAQAGKVQTWVHDRLREDLGREGSIDPKGWENQIKNEVGFVLGAEYSPYRGEATLWGDSPDADWRPYGAGRVGTVFTDGRVGVRGRWFLDGAAQEAWAPASEESTGVRGRYYLFADLSAGIALYNATIQGSLFGANRSVHETDISHAILDAELGVNADLGSRHSVRLSHHLVSPRIKGHEWRPNRHVYGRMEWRYRW